MDKPLPRGKFGGLQPEGPLQDDQSTIRENLDWSGRSEKAAAIAQPHRRRNKLRRSDGGRAFPLLEGEDR